MPGMLSLSSFNESDSVAYSCNAFSFIIGNGDAEFFFKLHDEFNGVKAVSAEIGGEGCCFCYFVFVNTKFVYDDSFNAVCNF